MTVRVEPQTSETALWRTTLEVADLLAGLRWVLIGAQMIRLLELEHGSRSGRMTVDVDVVVDVRLELQGTRRAAARLSDVGFEVSAERPYRFVRGREEVDLLAPDRLGPRADLTTIPPLVTTGIPGGTRALQTRRILRIEVVGLGAADIPVPTLAGAIVTKVRAYEARKEPRDLDDIVRLLALVDDVDEVRSQLKLWERKALGSVAPLRDARSGTWRTAADPDEARAAFARLSD